MLQGRIKIVTGPSVEPVTLSEALQHCHAVSSVEDSWFTTVIQAAREAAEEYHQRAYIQQTLEVAYDGTPVLPIQLPRSPTIEVSSIKTYDLDNAETELDLSDFIIDVDAEPAIIDFNYGNTWPSSSFRDISSVKIRFTAGYGTDATTVPAVVKSAILLYIGYLYENRACETVEPPAAFYNLLRPSRLHI